MSDKMSDLGIYTTTLDGGGGRRHINSYCGVPIQIPVSGWHLRHGIHTSLRAYYSPLLAPSGPRRMVHSSIIPNGVNNCLTSSSVCCLLSMPTKSFRSTQEMRQ